MKICCYCRKSLPESVFWKASHTKDKLTLWCRKCGSAKNKSFGLRAKYEAIHHYSNGECKCACCGETYIEFLTIDHTNGGGNQHRKSTTKTGGLAAYTWLRRNNWPIGFRVLCMNCNLSLGAYGYCPHNSDKCLSIDDIQPRKDNRGTNNKLAKLDENKVKIIRKLDADGVSSKELAKKFNVSYEAIRKVVTRVSWFYVD